MAFPSKGGGGRMELNKGSLMVVKPSQCDVCVNGLL